MVALRRARIDLDVVRAAIGGDDAALEQVIASWLPTLYGWCERLGAGRVDAEEAAHDVIMTLVRKIRVLDGPRRLPSWLFSTCQRVVANHRRRAWITRWLPGASLDHHVAVERTDAATDARDLTRRIHRVLDRVGKTAREVLVLCYLEERSVKEAAELLGIPPGTVKRRLFDARKRFRDLYDEGRP